MYLSKLTTLLKTFDRAQVNRLHKYAHAAYFQVYSPSAALLDYLLPLYPDFAPKKITVALIAKSSPSLSTRIKQETAGSRLLNAIDEFIAEENWQKDKAARRRHQLKGFNDLGLTKKYKAAFEKEMAQLNQNPGQDVDTFFDRHLLTELSHNGFEAKLNRTIHNDIMPVVQTLDAFYAIKKLRYLCEALNRKLVLGVHYHDEYIPLLLKILKPYTNPEYPYVYLFVNVYQMLAAETHQDFDLYYRLIKQFALRNTLTSTIAEAVAYAINQCLHWTNKGFTEAGNEYLWGIEWRLNNNLLLDNGKMIPAVFRNVVSIAVINGREPEFIETQLNLYAPYLPEHHDTLLAFAKGLYQFTLRNYVEASRFFLEAQAKEETIFNSIIRRWQWMNFYVCDADETDMLFNQLAAFEKYLQRNKKELHHVAVPFHLFIDYARKLISSFDRDSLTRHLEYLKNEEYFPGKPWLMEQLTTKHKKAHAQGARVKV